MTRSSMPGNGLLEAWSSHGDTAPERPVPLIHPRLRRLARSYVSHERRGRMRQPTAVVNEAFVRLFAARRLQRQRRAQLRFCLGLTVLEGGAS